MNTFRPDARLAFAGVLLLVVIGLMFALPVTQPPTLMPVQSDSATVSLASVAVHASATDCWTIIDGTVYDITAYIDRHPGGRRDILKACGVDASVLFATQDGEGSHSASARNILAGFAIGPIGTEIVNDTPVAPIPEPVAPTPKPVVTPTPKPTPAPQPTGPTLADVAKHATADDCWIVVNGGIYDVTSYIPIHPGGRNRIINQCGTDATTAFETQGGRGSHSSRAWSLLENYRVSMIDGTTPSSTNASTVNNPGSGYDDDDDEWEDDDD
jgi:cytochrome b involved in lipid metabolism